MTLKDKTRLIQGWAGTKQDGVYGGNTASAIIAKAGIEPPEKPAQRGMVKGGGKNIKRIVIHCAATPEGKEFDSEDIKRWHTAPKPQGQGWSRPGYHFVILLDGTVEALLPESRTGIHVRGRNTGSIAVCYIGGVDARGKAKDTRTPAQKAAMASLVKDLVKAYPGAKVLGHRDHLGVRKACPSFDVKPWWESVK